MNLELVSLDQINFSPILSVASATNYYQMCSFRRSSYISYQANAALGIEIIYTDFFCFQNITGPTWSKSINHVCSRNIKYFLTFVRKNMKRREQVIHHPGS